MPNPPELPRSTVEELALRYELEPTLRDVFVEGNTDQAILRWFIDACCTEAAGVGIYPIDVVDVPRQVLARYGLTPGNRSEVISLCLELEERLGSSATSATGVIDRDIDVIIPDSFKCGLILKSDFTCIEMYLFSEKCLSKMLKLAFPKTRRSAQDVTAQLAPILQELFLARAANHSLGLGAKWIAFEPYVSVANGVVQFRLDEFQRHYLQSGGLRNKRTEFEAEVRKLRAKAPCDVRYTANGHDAICLLGHYLRSNCKKAKDGDRTQPHVLVHLLTCCLETIDVPTEKMFQTLLKRLAAQPSHE